MADNLSYHFTLKGHQVTVVTPVPHNQVDDKVYNVVRQPSLKEKIRLVREADIVYSNGANLYSVILSFLLSKKFVWTHTGYQASCIDGLGWHDRAPAPMSPIASFRYHWKKSGPVKAITGLLKVAALRLVAHKYVSANIAISDWMMMRQPLPRQVRIYNPFPISRFQTKEGKDIEPEFDFVFLGRLVSEKGVKTLVEAMSILQKQYEEKITLCLIGDGPERSGLEKQAKELGVEENIIFLGRQTGGDLIKAVAKGKIAVVPSAWEEPFGGVATELMAAGKNIIVSRRGALAELIDDAGLVFDNRNANDLAAQMKKLYDSPQLQKTQKEKIANKILSFDETQLIDEYLDVFAQVIEKNNTPNFKHTLNKKHIPQEI